MTKTKHNQQIVSEEEFFKRNVGKFKVGDIIRGFGGGFWKILEIDSSGEYSGESHTCVSYNHETRKYGREKTQWDSHFSGSALEEIKEQQQELKNKIVKLDKFAKSLKL
jgi:hypothetical protein